MQRSEGETRNIIFDNRPQSYTGFFDHAWADRMLSAAHGTKLSAAMFSLCADWKGISNTFRMPALAVGMLESYHNGITSPHAPSALRVARAFRDYVLNRPEAALTHTKRKQLAQVIDELAARIESASAEASIPFDHEGLWQGLIENSEFVLSLRSSARLRYGALYFGYEEFLRTCVAVAINDPEYRVPNARNFVRDLNRCLWPTAGNELLADDAVGTARLVRNALAHNGGRMTAELEPRAHGLKVDKDGEIHLMAPDVCALFDLLHHKVEAASNQLATFPSFTC